jgi:hypothetical protein
MCYVLCWYMPTLQNGDRFGLGRARQKLTVWTKACAVCYGSCAVSCVLCVVCHGSCGVCCVLCVVWPGAGAGRRHPRTHRGRHRSKHGGWLPPLVTTLGRPPPPTAPTSFQHDATSFSTRLQHASIHTFVTIPLQLTPNALPTIFYQNSTHTSNTLPTCFQHASNMLPTCFQHASSTPIQSQSNLRTSMSSLCPIDHPTRPRFAGHISRPCRCRSSVGCLV